MSGEIVIPMRAFTRIVIALNTLSYALANLEGQVIINLDGEEDPQAHERWARISRKAHEAAAEARFASEERRGQ